MYKIPFISALSLSLLLLTGCKNIFTSSGGSKKNTEIRKGSVRPNFLADRGRDNLTQAQAIARRAQVKKIQYLLDFKFKFNSPEVEGETILLVDLNSTATDLRVDFDPEKLIDVTVNGKKLSQVTSREGSFDIPSAELKEENMIVIRYKTKASGSGNGLVYFKDVDNKEYFYTQFEPYAAHQLFPCLDQPDIKAEFVTSIEIPNQWEAAIANSREVERFPTSRGTRVQFKKTESISPYLVFVGAGNYAKWTSEWNGVPMSIYARQSLKQFVDADKMFELTKKGFEFFTEYFDYKYPFQKYDQIFCPNYTMGGMENVGAVTYTEQFIFKGTVSRSLQLSRDNVFMHEMAHMWFGNLVTMKWWDDLWLNEGFATYMATLAQADALKDKNAWPNFRVGKSRAYSEDDLVTTHPIMSKVVDTESTLANFDSITYEKGASAIKQLSFLVGPDAFKQGMRNYFKKYEWSNTTLPDFTSAISETAGRDLKDWSFGWLETAGPNPVKPEIECTAGKVSKFKLSQEPNRSGELLVHKTKVAAFKIVGDQLTKLGEAAIEYSGAETISDALNGIDCPDVLLPNYEDHDYGAFKYDPVTVKNIREHFGKLPSDFEKIDAMFAVTDMYRAAEIKTADFMDLVSAIIRSENDPVLLSRTGRTASGLFLYYMTKTERDQYGVALEELIISRLKAVPANDPLQVGFIELMQSFGRMTPAKNFFRGLLDGSTTPNGFKLDPRRRWAIVINLAGLGEPDYAALIAAAAQIDPSSDGKDSAYAANIAVPTLENKERAWKELTENSTMGYSQWSSGADQFAQFDRDDLLLPFKDRFFALAKTKDWAKDEARTRAYFDNLFPWICTQEVLKESVQHFNEVSTKLSFSARKSWMQYNERLGRCIKIREANQ